MCTLSCHYDGFVETHAFEHMMFNYTSLALMNQKKAEQANRVLYRPVT